MNLFVVGWSAERPVEAGKAASKLAELLERLPFFPGQQPTTWTSPNRRSAAAFVTHPPGLVGGVPYADITPERIELWSGHLQGRFARATATDDALTIDQDCMGSYPLYETNQDGVRWISNNPALLKANDDLNPAAVASLIAGGWPLSGDPIHADIRRIQPDPIDPIPLIGRGLDADKAASDLTDTTRALMDWPGRPNVVPVTAGRDSRLILAAALRTGIDFETNTGGRPGEPDVDIGRQLAQIAGKPHALIPDDPHGSLYGSWRQAATLLRLTTGGTASLADAVGFPHGPREGPLPLWHSGQGGEIARAYYARVRGDDKRSLADSLYTVFAARRPGRREPLNQDGEALVRDQIAAWVDDTLQAGAKPEDVPDLFYLQKRMGTWAGPTHGAVEYVRDTTSPLWHERMLPHLLALRAKDRAAERFHHDVLQRLSPELARAPGWFTPQTPLTRKVAQTSSLAKKAMAEARRRTRRHTPQSAPADPFDRIRAELKQQIDNQPDHPAWQLLDRARTEQLLTEPQLDEVRRYYLWRLATIF